MTSETFELRGRRAPGDENIIVRFFTLAEESTLKSAEAGYPVFIDVEAVELRMPSNGYTIVTTLVDDEYRIRFPDEYAAYKRNAVLDESGTPIELFAALSPSEVASLKSRDIRTVEHLAGLSDSLIQQLMGGNALRTKAQAFLKARADSAIVEKQDAVVANQAAHIEALTKELAALRSEKAAKTK